MSMRMELSDLPPKYRAQAEAQIAARCRAKAPTLEAVAAAAKKTGREFDSRGEYDYYMGMILPKVQRGEIVKVESHRRFTMLPEKEYGNVKLPAMHYTPDFVLTYADGTVEVVEVKKQIHPAAAARLHPPPPYVHRPCGGAAGLALCGTHYP